MTKHNKHAARFGARYLDRIDNTLLTYDSQHADGEQPWPYRGF